MSRSKLWKTKAKGLYEEVKALRRVVIEFDALAKAGELLHFASKHACISKEPGFLSQEQAVREAMNYWKFRYRHIYGQETVDETKIWGG